MRKQRDTIVPAFTVSVAVLAALSVFSGVALFVRLSNDSVRMLHLLGIAATVLLAAVSLFGLRYALRRAKTAPEKERELHEVNEIFINAAPFVMNVWDDAYNLVSTSSQAVEIFGLSGKEQYIERFFEFSPEYQPCGTKSREKAMNYVKEAFREGRRVQFEWMHQTLSGEPLPTEINLVRFMRDGKYRVAAYTIDLRPVKAAEAFTRKLLDNSPLLMEFWDKNGTLLDCNVKMLDTFKVSGISEFRERYYEFTPKYQPCGTSSKKKNMDMIQRAVEKGSSSSDWMFTLPNGDELPVGSTWVHVMRQSEPVIIVYSHDLRPVKQEAQRAIAEIQRRETAEDESKAKTRFLARMSHEMRTPMNAVLGIAQIQLQKEGHPPETEEAFSRIHNSASLLLNIINDILDLSKVEAGKMEIISAAYELTSLIIDTAQLNCMYIGSKGIEFKLNVDKSLPVYLIGDALRIKQILNNLLSNAFKYTQKGTVTLSFGVEAAPEPGYTTLVLTVSDTGQGMGKEDIEFLFDEFARFNMHTNRATEGSGLGMPIIHSLVTMMQGDINVESEPGKGSVFTVRLPQKLCIDDTLGEEAAANLQSWEFVSQQPLKKMAKFEHERMPYGRVLVVDDVEVNIFVVEGILDAYGITVETAKSGLEAVEKVKSGQVYDIIFMDHMMPEMDGMEAAKHIRAMGYTHPIVALTANALKDAAKMFMNNGFSGFISKPIDIAQIDAYLVRFIRNKHLPQSR
ncbi:MAG: ATP-binding protein [Treponema sp.]|nr:ATP-binding protein [Treponema sp.]